MFYWVLLVFSAVSRKDPGPGLRIFCLRIRTLVRFGSGLTGIFPVVGCAGPDPDPKIFIPDPDPYAHVLVPVSFGWLLCFVGNPDPDPRVFVLGSDPGVKYVRIHVR